MRELLLLKQLELGCAQQGAPNPELAGKFSGS